MKYGDFKKYLKVITPGGKIIPADDLLDILVLQSLREVALEAEPLLLNTRVKDKDVIKILEDGSYILAPSVPSNDEAEIIIDKDLIYAVANIVVSKYSSLEQRKLYKDEANSIINMYQWNRFRAIEYGGINNSTYTEVAIDVMGEKTIYINKTLTTRGYVYEWDENFISIVNDYLLGMTLTNISKSDRNNLNRLILFSDNNMSQDDRFYSDFVEFNKFLGSK